MGQNVHTYGITIEHVWEHSKIMSFPNPANLKMSLTWKSDAESTFLGLDLAHIAKNIQKRTSKKAQWSQAVRKRLVFNILLNVGLKQEICSYALKPKQHVQFSTSTVPIKGPTHSRNDLQKSQSVYFRVKLRAKKCGKILSSSWKLKHSLFEPGPRKCRKWASSSAVGYKLPNELCMEAAKQTFRSRHIEE